MLLFKLGLVCILISDIYLYICKFYYICYLYIIY